ACLPPVSPRLAVRRPPGSATTARRRRDPELNTPGHDLRGGWSSLCRRRPSHLNFAGSGPLSRHRVWDWRRLGSRSAGDELVSVGDEAVSKSWGRGSEGRRSCGGSRRGGGGGARGGCPCGGPRGGGEGGGGAGGGG